ncbi:translocation protein TolB, partial [Streptomyces amritsarensis]
MERRTFLRGAVIGSSAAAFGGTLMRGAAYAAPAQPGAGPYGALGAAAAHGIILPVGVTRPVIARSGQTGGGPA